MARSSTTFVKGQGGKPKGTLNTATKEIKEISERLLTDIVYQENLLQRLRDGTEAPAVVVTLYHYAFGKPVDTVKLTGANGGAVQVQTVNLSRLSLEEKLALLEYVDRSSAPVQ